MHACVMWRVPESGGEEEFFIPLFPVDVSVETLSSCTVVILWSDRSNEIHRGFFWCRSNMMREEVREKCEWDPNNWVNIFRAWTIRKKSGSLEAMVNRTRVLYFTYNYNYNIIIIIIIIII